ncbi:invasion associated locus B family protein [Brucella gallinifaecis]|uniref:Invasion associated locus B family protein n=1 Tax=Brucella gallinifaecis TaxID=215590 RepID=A0A502BNZ1_9HYPH|nr:invasion associated locus B family protein [Brucella gallinifaecis]TPF75560.1 invasion associated locus B family protein [Brucella gallinifaecis]
MSRVLILPLVMTALVLPELSAYAQPEFRVRPSSVTVPDGVPIGQYRRVIHPFENWTLICDDNLATKIRLCDIRQEVEIVGAGIIFSWALTATENGPPMMKLMGPASIGVNGEIILTFNDGSTHRVKMLSCNTSNCIGHSPAGPKTQQHIKENLPINISFDIKRLGNFSFNVPMKGLSNALNASD